MITILTGLAIEASVITDHSSALVIHGPGARDNLDQMVPASTEAIISFGIAGAVAPGVPVGTIINPDAVVAEGPTWQTDLAWNNRIRAAFRYAFRGITYSTNRNVAIKAAGKAVIHAQHPQVQSVDQISYAVAEFATRRGIPFVVLQAISDSYDQDVPVLDVEDISANGNSSIGTILGGLIKDPAALPGTLDVAVTTGHALQSLRLAYSALGPLLQWMKE